MREGKHACAFCEGRFDHIEIQFSCVRDRNRSHGGARFRSDELPWDDVSMVLHLGDEDFIAWLQAGAEEALGDEVGRFGGASDKENFPWLGGSQGLRDSLAGFVVARGGLHAEEMHASMDVGIVLTIEIGNRVNDHVRLLSRGGIVEIDERLSVHLSTEDREVRTHACHVQASGHWPS